MPHPRTAIRVRLGIATMATFCIIHNYHHPLPKRRERANRKVRSPHIPDGASIRGIPRPGGTELNSLFMRKMLRHYLESGRSLSYKVTSAQRKPLFPVSICQIRVGFPGQIPINGHVLDALGRRADYLVERDEVRWYFVRAIQGGWGWNGTDRQDGVPGKACIAKDTVARVL